MKKQKDWLASEGMEFITMEGADRAKWVAAASDAGWAEVLERSPEHGAALKKLFSKYAQDRRRSMHQIAEAVTRFCEGGLAAVPAPEEEKPPSGGFCAIL